jgi:hypothetical protein
MLMPSKIRQSSLRATGLAIWLGAAAVAPIVISLMPSSVQAYTARVNVAIEREGDESYEALLQRAELIARAAAQRSFDRDILINDVSVMIVAQSQGVEVPILSLGVSRQQWRSRPDPRRWATYYKTAKTLLRLDNVATPGNFPSPPRPAQPARVVPPPRPQSPLPPATPTQGTPAPRPGTATPNNQPATAPRTTTPNQPTRNPNVPPEDQEDDEL